MMFNKNKCQIKITIISVALVAVTGFLFSANSARADYYKQGILKSTNVLSGATVTAINSFSVTSSIPANTSVSVQFSQDRVNFYNSSGTKGGWDSCSDGTTNIDLSGLGWSGGILYYKLKLENSDNAVTPSVSSAQVDYTGTEVPADSGVRYSLTGILKSTNILGGATVTAINGFKVTSSLPAGASMSISFSQDGTNFYNSSGTKGGWDSCSDGTTNIDLSGLSWSGGCLYYKLKLETIDNEQTPDVSDVYVDYDGTAVPPPSDDRYPVEGTLVSKDLLSGTGCKLIGGDHFSYAISSLPCGTHVYAQFSTDNANWYSSDGTLWGEDELSFGDHTSSDMALSLSALNWGGSASFYYKLRFTATSDNKFTPVITKAGLLEFVVIINSSGVPGGSKATINSSQTDKMTDGLVLMQSFDGNHMDWSQSTAEARDQSGQGNHGDVVGATAAIGKIGQALNFDGSGNYVSQGNVSDGIHTVAFWIKADDLTDRKVMDLNGTEQIEIDGTGNIAATNFPGTTTIYIDGTASSALTAGWHHIVITDTAGVNASAMDIGRVSAGYFDGELDEVRLYTRVLSSDEIGDLYRMGRVTFRK